MTYPALREFVNRVKRVQGTKSTEFRITTTEAVKISLELNELLIRLQKEEKNENGKVNIAGGTF